MYKGKKTILRAFEKSDLELSHRLYNNLELQRLANDEAVLPVSMPVHERFVAESADGKNSETSFLFAVTDLKGRFIGDCCYLNRDARNRTCDIGMVIADPKYQGKGYGADAAAVLLDILFNELNIRKVTLRVFSFNMRAIACYKKLGFEEEGRLKEHFWRAGRYHDELLMALFARGYFAGQTAGKGR